MDDKRQELQNQFLELEKNKELKQVGTQLGNKEIGQELVDLLAHLKVSKPNDRSEKDRRFAIVITDLEKVKAYFQVYILDT